MTIPERQQEYPLPGPKPLVLREQDIEAAFIEKLRSLKYTYRPDIRDRAALERNFRQKFEALNRVTLTDGESQRLLDELITPDDGTPLSYTLVIGRPGPVPDATLVDAACRALSGSKRSSAELLVRGARPSDKAVSLLSDSADSASDALAWAHAVERLSALGFDLAAADLAGVLPEMQADKRANEGGHPPSVATTGTVMPSAQH